MLSWQTLLVLAACAIPAVAGAAVCDAYTPETPCIALEGVCYNAGTCQCETHFQKAECLVDPCSVNKCADGYKCRSSRCGGCHHQCDKIEAPPAPVCDAYTPETPCIALEGVCYNAGTCKCETHLQKAECLVDPCSVNKCADGYKCRSSRCGGCHHQCDKIEATPAPAPTPAPRVCNAYTQETPCIALEGVCYNAGTCQCETHFQKAECLVDPCSVNKCADGYKCRSSRCGGCHHQCDKIEAPPAPVCDAYTPETPCIALEGVCYNAGTCKCETHLQKAECLVDPCSVNKCADGYKCRSSRCGGCHHQCDKIEAPPAPVCDAYTPETPCIALEGVCYNAGTCKCETHLQKAECLVDPCSVNKCADGYKCRSSRCGGCHHQCDKIEATPAPAPTPAPRVCNAYTQETPCIALEGVCYNAGTCQCETHFQKAECLVDPCSVNKCADGYKCRSSRCGGCHHQCDKIEAPPAPVCDAYTPETPCIALEGVCYNAGTCKCETHLQKAECLVDPCSVNKCADGYKCRSSRCGGCHHQCDKIEATPAPAPTPAPRVCNAYTQETPCIALEGVCYNAGTCQCETHFQKAECLVDPCSVNKCADGYKCRSSRCGGCHHQCDKIEAPPAPVCDAYTPETPCIALEGVCYNAGTCKCETHLQKAECLVDPCSVNKCADGYKCRSSRCGGCHHQCDKIEAPPAPVCDAYTPETPCIALEGVCYNAGTCKCETHLQKAECLVDPCSVNKCADGYKCRSSRCGGCHHQCDKIEATPAPAPTPAPRVCNAYTQETPCIALEGVCYNAGTCQCETHFQKAECLVDPCSVNKCADGYKCRSSRCGGCHHQCDKIEAPPAPVCDAYTPETPCIALEGVCYNAGTCKCETHLQKAECLVDPCSVNKCADGYKCRSSRCGGCHHQCDKIEAPPAPVCDAYTPETPCIALEGVCYNAGTCKCETHLQKAECLVDPCSVNKCADGYKCRSSRCGGCHHQCDKIEATPAPAPTPAPRVCNAYTQETPCIALEGVCYNAGTCQCETHFQKAECLVDPCSVNKCADGYKCRSSRCGGCHHQCDKIEAPPAPVCDAYTPETPCIALEGVCYNAGTCKCETHLQKAECLVDPCSVNKCADGYKCRSSRCGGCHHQCDKIEAPPAPVCDAYTPETPCIALEGVCYNAGTCKCETHLQKAECLVDPCSVNKCADGYKCRSSRCGGCHHQCDKIEATPAPAPTPAPRVCNAYTPETPCIAQEGVCYNSGTCQCGFHPRVQCWANPCWWSPCASGYECRPTNCGECGHQCSRV